MTKLDFLLVVIVMIIALCIFSIFQITANKGAFDFFVKMGVLDNTKETFKAIIITFYSLLGLLFIVLALIFIRILAKLYKK